MGNGLTSTVGMDADRTIPELAGQPVQSIMSTGLVRDPALKDKLEDKVSQKTPYTILQPPHTCVRAHIQTIPWY